MLETHLPRTAADAVAKRDAAAAELTRRIGRNDAAAKGLIAELAQLGDDTSPASVAYRDRIREHFTALHDETTALQAQLGDLQNQAGALSDAALIDQIPYAPASSTGHPTTSARPCTPPWTCTALTAPTRTRSPSAPPSPTRPRASSRHSPTPPEQTTEA
jgi:hypothetical protein